MFPEVININTSFNCLAKVDIKLSAELLSNLLHTMYVNAYRLEINKDWSTEA